MTRALENQMALDLFTEPEYPARPPTWEDVQKGRAHVAYRYEACDKCAGAPVCYWDAKERKCTHEKGRYGYPKKITFGGWHGWLCRRAYHEWGAGEVTIEQDGIEMLKCSCGGFPKIEGSGTAHWGESGAPKYSRYFIVCITCGKMTSAHELKADAAREWNQDTKGE